MITSRRAFHFALRRGSLLAPVRGIGSDGTRARSRISDLATAAGASRRRRTTLRSHPPTRAAHPTTPSKPVAACRRARARPAGRRAGWHAPRAEPRRRSSARGRVPRPTPRPARPAGSRVRARRAASVDRLTGEDGVHRRAPTDRAGSRNSPPAAAIRLCRTSASPNVDRDVATTTSAARTISRPPAVARPSTATTIGLMRSRYTNPPNPPRSVSSVAAEPVS